MRQALATKTPALSIAALLAALVLLLGGAAALAVLRLGRIADSVDTVYKDSVVSQQQLRAVADAYAVDIASAVAKARDSSISDEQAVILIDAARRSGSEQWAHYKNSLLAPEEVKLIGKTMPLLARADAVVEQMRIQLRRGDGGALAALAATDMPASFAPLSDALDRLYDYQVGSALQENERSQRGYVQAAWGIAALVGAAIVVAGALAWTLAARRTADRKTGEMRIRRLGDFYAALSRTNQLIVRERDVQKLLEGLCDICVDTGHARLACVQLVDGVHSIRTATAGPAAEFFAGLPKRWDMTAPEHSGSVTVQAIRLGQHVICQDYQTDLRASSYRERAVANRIGSVAVFPLRRGGIVIGSLTLYSSEARFFDEPLIHLLDELVADISFALDNIDRDAARIEAVQQTEASLDHFRKIFKSAPVAMAITSRIDHRIIALNDVMGARYGLPSDQLVGKRLRDLDMGLFEEDRQRLDERIRTNGSIRNLEMRVRTPDGEIRTTLMCVEPIEYRGEPCFLSMSLDVTELRAAEQSREAQATAEAANRAKTEFLSRMSHELRTPLNAVLGFSRLLRSEAAARLTAQDLSQLDHIHQAGWHLLDLVNDVLDVSRIETGRLDVQLRDVQLAAILDESLQISEPIAQHYGVVVGTLHRSAAPMGVVADPARLRQVIINLLSNAIKYNRPGGSVQLTVTRHGAAVHIEVADTGLGMTPEQLSHLYEPFNRLGRERGGIEGTGIGLALTRQLVRLMQGELSIESQIGNGTRARVVLPYSEHVATALPPNVDARTGNLPPHGTVLYIEDNPVNVLLVEQILARWTDVRFLHAIDGCSGIEQARAVQPDLVLLDMQLPDIAGIEVLRRLRSDTSTRHLNVVSLSASAMAEEIEHALQEGASAYWTKPLDFDRFLVDVAAQLKSRNETGAKAGQSAS